MKIPVFYVTREVGPKGNETREDAAKFFRREHAEAHAADIKHSSRLLEVEERIEELHVQHPSHVPG